MKHFLVLLGMNRLVSTSIQPIVPSAINLSPLFQTQSFQWRKILNGKMKSLKFVTTLVGWGSILQHLAMFFKTLRW